MSKNIFIEDEIAELEEVIAHLNDLFEKGEDCIHPKTGKEVSHPEFDALVKKLEKLAPDSEVLTAITGSSLDDDPGVKKVQHNPPMASISKAIGTLKERDAELRKWLTARLTDLKYKFDPNGDLETLSTAKYDDGTPIFAMSLKRDGVAVSLYYKNGVLDCAALRPRDGINGVDVSDHVRNVMGIQTKLKEDHTFALRGELECHISDFIKVNDRAKKNGTKIFANPRNMTAGTMNPLGDSSVVRERMIRFTGHGIEAFSKAPYKTARERAIWANKELGVQFVRVEPFKYSNLAKLEEVVKTLDYETDGVVIEMNRLDDAEQVGKHGNSANANPKCKLAWKFAEQKAEPEVKSVIWETGRTGRCVPVAHFDAVRLAGTDVRKCTLHNLGFVLRFKVGAGAVIEIEKAGKIIPKALRSVKPAKNVEHPSHCPSCGYKLIVREGDSKDENGNKIKTQDLVCENSTSCPSQNLGRRVHFLSTLGVKGIAESTVKDLIESKLVSTLGDYYRLTTDKLERAGFSQREALLNVARIHMVESPEQEKSNKILESKTEKAIANKKVIPLAKLIAALGISGASKGTGRELALHFGTIDAILKASNSEFESVSNIGSKTAGELFTFFQEHKDEVNDLLDYIEPEKPKTGKFTGVSFVITGTFSMEREYYEKLIVEEGGKLSSSVSKNTKYLLIGSEPGATKYDKGMELKAAGVPIQIIEDEKEVNNLLGVPQDEDTRAF